VAAGDQENTGGEIRALTGLRGAAALLVALYHWYPFAFIPLPSLARAQSKGYLWVDLFFVLSGFLMSLTYAGMFGKIVTLPAMAGFLLRRLARLYPLYIALLTVRVFYTLALWGNLHAPDGAWAGVSLDHPAAELMANALLIQAWGLCDSITGPSWSVSTECAAYFAFPGLVGLILLGTRRTALAAVALAAAGLALVAWRDTTDGAFHSGVLDAYDATQATPLLRCLAGFILGMAAFRLSRAPWASRLAARNESGAVVLALLIVGFFGGAPDLAVYPLFPALVLILSVNQGWFARAFACRPVHRLGAISFSLYLIHTLVTAPLRGMEAWFTTWLPHTVALLLADVLSLSLLLLL